MLGALLQVRGSIPLVWSQQPTSLSPKPEIVLQHLDPMFQVHLLKTASAGVKQSVTGASQQHL